MTRFGLPFAAVEKFDQEAIEARQHLHGRICELIWDPDRIAKLVDIAE